jgi:hypothetical protein
MPGGGLGVWLRFHDGDMWEGSAAADEVTQAVMTGSKCSTTGKGS